jgi:hypothetical protein
MASGQEPARVVEVWVARFEAFMKRLLVLAGVLLMTIGRSDPALAQRGGHLGFGGAFGGFHAASFGGAAVGAGWRTGAADWHLGPGWGGSLVWRAGWHPGWGAPWRPGWGWRGSWGFPIALGLTIGYPYYSYANNWYDDGCTVWNGYELVYVCYQSYPYPY